MGPFPQNRGVWVCFALVMVSVMMGGCAGPAEPNLRQEHARLFTAPSSDPSDRGSSAPTPASSLELRVRAAVNDWRGTPHRMGGSGRNGIDCSGFVQRIYRDLFGRSLPRSTTLQVRSGAPVDQRHLAAGDLVFFRPPKKGGHVGIYLGNNEFAHASTSKGVTVSSLEDLYWRQCYWTARRYLD